jgi:glycosyltransferase involved in cell wall biosynthesis
MCERRASGSPNAKTVAMRIAFLGTSNPEVNASQVRLYHLARGMADAGHQVTVVVPDDPINREFPVTRESAVAFHLIKTRSAMAELFTKFREVSAGNFDVIHVVGIGLRSLQLVGRPFRRPFYVQDYDEAMTLQEGHSRAKRTYFSIVEGLSRQRAHGVVVASRSLESLVREHRPDLGRKLLYLPIGYDPSFEGASKNLDSKLRAIVGERPVITWVGSFWPAYGIDEIVDLAATLARRGRPFTIMLVGDGPSFEATRSLVAARKLSNVLLPGRVSLADLQAYLRISQVFLLPFQESPQNLHRCPTKLFQYIANNRPVVTNRVGEVAEALGDAGFYYESRSVESMADACEKAVASSAKYDRSDLIPPIFWSERARRYRDWIESLDLPT